MGLGAAPLPKVRATPAPTSRSQPGTMRKREAPTPCPTTSTVKRPRVGLGLPPRSVSVSSSRTVSGSTARSASVVSSRSSASVSSAGTARVRQLDPHATPTANAARRFGAPAGSRANALAPPRMYRTPGETPGKRARKSFKPRQSLAGGLLAGRFAVDEMAEEDDVF